jgi:glutamate synthase (NADPH) small chain
MGATTHRYRARSRSASATGTRCSSIPRRKRSASRRRAAWTAAFRSATTAALSATSSPTGTTSPTAIAGGRRSTACTRRTTSRSSPGSCAPRPARPPACSGSTRIPVAIKQVEWEIIRRGWEEGWIAAGAPGASHGRSVAVVGSGPAGLAAAQQLTRAGHTVTLFEKNDRIGGLLRYGIPDFKLEKWLIDRRLEQLREEGVQFQTGVHVGVDLSAAELRRSFDAVLLCTGSEAPRDLPVPGRELAGRAFRDGVPAAEQPARGRGSCAPSGRDPGHRQARDRAGRRRHRIGLRRHLAPPGGQVGDIDRAAAAAARASTIPRRPGRSGRSCIATSPARTRRAAAGSSRSRPPDCLAAMVGSARSMPSVSSSERSIRPRAAREMREIPGSEFEIPADLVLLAMGFVHPVHDGLLEGLGVVSTGVATWRRTRGASRRASPGCSPPGTAGGASRSWSGRSGRAARPRAQSTPTWSATRRCSPGTPTSERPAPGIPLPAGRSRSRLTRFRRPL